jgi:phosphoserine phosphatase RsbU/P
MKILIVDDSVPSLNALAAILAQSGYSNVVKYDSAPGAIRYLQSEDQKIPGSQVDLILMDVMMPEMNGIEAVRKIKTIDYLKDIPIVMVSVRDEEERIEKAFEAGAIDYIGKPIKKLELRARVRSILKLKEETDQRKAHEKGLEETIEKLKKAMAEIKTLSGLLPICSNCKKVRDDQGYWKQVEQFVSEYSNVEFSHGLCPDCIRTLYPDIADKILSKGIEDDLY